MDTPLYDSGSTHTPTRPEVPDASAGDELVPPTESLTPRIDAAVAPLRPVRRSATTTAWFLALLGWSLLLAFYHLQGGAQFEPTDCWVAQTAREMLEADRWIVPVFSGETRLQKSPGSYWAVMVASLLRGGPVDEVAARIPSAIAGLLLVLNVFWLTRHIAGDRPAVFAGFATASSTLFLYWSHRGASDLGLAVLCSLSLSCWWIAANKKPPGRQRTALFLLAYFLAGLGMLYKLPMPLVCVGLPGLAYVVLRWRWRILAHPVHLVGLLVFLAPWLPWVVAVIAGEPTALAKWRVEFVDRFTGALPNVAEQKHWYFYLMYLGSVALLTVPYTLSLPQSFKRVFDRREPQERDGLLFVLIWFLSLLAFFTASTGKEYRYILPALPPLFVLLGVELARFFDPDRRVPILLQRLALIAIGIGVPAAMIGGAFGLYRVVRNDGIFAFSEVWPFYLVAAVLFTIGTWIAAVLFARGKRNASFGALVGTMWVFWLWFWPTLMPVLGSERSFIDFAQQINQRIPADQRAYFCHVGPQEARVVWYGDIRMPRIIDQLALLEMEGGERSLDRERRIVAEEMVRRLEGETPTYIMLARPNYVDFMIQAPRELAEAGRTMPAVHLWLESKYGPPYTHYVVISNQLPPWPEPTLNPPSQRLAEASAATTQPLR
jgi:4-amino-4-deoxy-L-arabinose transferase-like glycosyltransferase